MAGNAWEITKDTIRGKMEFMDVKSQFIRFYYMDL